MLDGRLASWETPAAVIQKCKPSSKKFELIKLPSRDFVIFGGDDPESLEPLVKKRE
jgi:hypothetical protein